MINVGDLQDNIKLVLFDFDDTLCIHQYHTDEEWKDYYASMVRGDINFWHRFGSKKNKHMELFMNMCNIYNENIKFGLISAVTYVCEAVCKVQWVANEYNRKMRNYCVSNVDAKAHLINTLIENEGYKPSDILLIDDLYSNLEQASKLGIYTATPMEVVNLVNDKILDLRG